MRSQQPRKTPAWQYAALVMGLGFVGVLFYGQAKSQGWFGLNPTGLAAKKVEVAKATPARPAAPTTPPANTATSMPPPGLPASGMVQDATEVELELAELQPGDRDPLARWYITEREIEREAEAAPRPPEPPPTPPDQPLVEFPPPQPGGAPLVGPGATVVPAAAGLEPSEPEALRMAYAPAIPERARRPETAGRLVGTVSGADGEGMAVVRSGEGRRSAEFLSAGARVGGAGLVRSVMPGRVEVGNGFRRSVMEVSGGSRGVTTGDE